MRLAIDSLVALMLAAVLTGVVLKSKTGGGETAELNQVRSEVRRFQQQVMLQAALEQVELSEGGFPKTVDPEWFHGDLPANSLLDPATPWLEVASRSQLTMLHPPLRVATGEKTARFWYNPRLGLVRARVPAGISDSQAIRWYNQINDCDLATLYDVDDE